ncbi:MAG: hypothetical protein C0513_01820 [Isosphaera sp.]|nr:hypothetical protein [Isosphaera sp.]
MTAAMNETSKLLRVFRVDQQLRGLRSRVDAAERFLEEQRRLHAELETKLTAASAQLKQLRATAAGHEGEAQRVEARLGVLREQMNSAKTNKEYTAFLNEVNNLKGVKDAAEKQQLEAMEKTDSAEKLAAELTASVADRAAIVERAQRDRDEKRAEVRDRLSELQSQRTSLAAEVAADALRVLEDLIRRHGDDAMAPLEVLDLRAHEYSCGSCMMSLPAEVVMSVSRGRMTRCVSCSCLLFSETELFGKDGENGKPAKKPRSRKAKAKAEDDGDDA